MKKYSNLFVFLVVLGLILSTSVVKAEDSASAGTESQGGQPLLGQSLLGNGKDLKNQLQQDRLQERQKLEAERQAFINNLQTEREAFKAQVEQEKKNFKNATLEVRKGFFTTASEIISQRFTEAIKKLGDIQTRAADAIAKLKTDGKDTTTAQSDLDLSKQKLSDAQTKLAAVKALLPTDGNKITPDIWAQIKVGVREAKDLLKESKSALMDAIKEIQNLNGGNNAGNQPPQSNDGNAPASQ